MSHERALACINMSCHTQQRNTTHVTLPTSPTPSLFSSPLPPFPALSLPYFSGTRQPSTLHNLPIITRLICCLMEPSFFFSSATTSTWAHQHQTDNTHFSHTSTNPHIHVLTHTGCGVHSVVWCDVVWCGLCVMWAFTHTRR